MTTNGATATITFSAFQNKIQAPTSVCISPTCTNPGLGGLRWLEQFLLRHLVQQFPGILKLMDKVPAKRLRTFMVYVKCVWILARPAQLFGRAVTLDICGSFHTLDW